MPGAAGARAQFTTHGVYVEPGNGPVYKLFVVGHGARESIEVFRVDTAPATPAVTWLGCVIAPDPIGLNSVRGLPDGGFITTNFLPRGGTREATQRMLGGERNGELWEWHTASGWQKVPGSEAAGANGVELSDDGKTLYVAAWGSQSFFRLSRGATPPKRDEIPLGFRVDNIHWARDGSLFAVGQAGAELESREGRPEHARGSRRRDGAPTRRSSAPARRSSRSATALGRLVPRQPDRDRSGALRPVSRRARSEQARRARRGRSRP